MEAKFSKSDIEKAFLAGQKGETTLEQWMQKSIVPITEKIKSFSDVLELVPYGDDALKLLNYSGPDNDMLGAKAFLQITLIAKALNEGWEPDWTNSNEHKYYPWFELKSGVGFSYDVCDFWHPGTHAGSRLCFKTAELAKYAGTQFTDIYNVFLTLNAK